MVKLAQSDDEFIGQFAKQIFSMDMSIRFLAIADEKAKIYAYQMKPHLSQHLTDDELEKFIMNWVVQIMMFDKYERFTGALEYYLLKFHNVIGAAMPLRQGPISEDKSRTGRLFLIMSFELGIDCAKIIEERILPLISESKDYFA